MNLLEWNLSIAVLISALLLARGLLLHRLPKRMLVLLWDLLLRRLLFPIPVASRFSVFNLLENRPTPGAVPDLPGTLPSVRGTGGAVGEMAPAGGGASLTAVLGIIWAAGVLLGVLYLLAGALQLARRNRESLPAEEPFIREWLAAQRLKRPLRIRSSAAIRTPMTCGVFRPVILLPAGMDVQNREQMEFVLTHELTHIRRFDVVRKCLLSAVMCLYWFHPLVWLFVLFANRDLELSCDEAVLRRAGGGKRGAYALALLSLEEQRALPLCGGFSANTARERIEAVMKFGRKSVPAVLAVAVFALCAAVLFGTSPQPAGDGSAKYRYGPAGKSAHPIEPVQGTIQIFQAGLLGDGTARTGGAGSADAPARQKYQYGPAGKSAYPVEEIPGEIQETIPELSTLGTYMLYGAEEEGGSAETGTVTGIGNRGGSTVLFGDGEALWVGALAADGTLTYCMKDGGGQKRALPLEGSPDSLLYDWTLEDGRTLAVELARSALD